MDKIFLRISLHLWLSQSPISTNREISQYSQPSWNVCFFDAVWGFCGTSIIWISHMNLLNKNVDFSVGLQALSGFIAHWHLQRVYFISVQANQAGNIHIPVFLNCLLILSESSKYKYKNSHTKLHKFLAKAKTAFKTIMSHTHTHTIKWSDIFKN